jgi:RNA polymerase sigma-70 factor (ECF subfamily)
VYDEAHRDWPDLALPFDTFTRHLERLGAPDGISFGSDLFLTFACLEGEPGAIVYFEERILSATRGVVGRMRPDTDFIDEVLQELRTKMLVGDREQRKALAGYAGRGPLLAWVRVAASRAAIDALRAAGAAPPLVEVPEVLQDHDLGPEVRVLVESHREAFQAALGEALSALSAQERNLLRRHLVDGMSLEEIAAPYGVHPATIARRLASLRDGIADAVRARLTRRFGKLDDDQLQSLFRAIRSQVYVTLSPLLRTYTRPEEDIEG